MANKTGRSRPGLMTWFALGSVIVCGGAFLLVSVIVVLIAGPFLFSGGNEPEQKINNTAGIPAEFLALINDAANAAGCVEVTPALLAAQLNQESGFDPLARSPVGAMGIAQFMPGTWASHGSGDVFNPADAIPAAARYDCAVSAAVGAVDGNRQELMLAAYNAGAGAVLRYAGIPPYTETRNYVRTILAQAQVYGDSLVDGALVDGGVVAPVLAFMESQLGKPYVWGAEGPAAWDCSSLVRAAYRTIGVELPRVTTDQLAAGPRVSGVDPQPGDLLFIPGTDGTAAAPGHVGMYVGDGRVVAAKGARWGVVASALSDWTTIVAVTRPATGRVE